MCATDVLDIYDTLLKIVHLGMLSLVIARKLWVRAWAHSALKFYCNNLSVVQVVCTGETRDNMQALCLKNFWLITVSYAIDLPTDHIQSCANKRADLLSRIYSPKTINLSLLEGIHKSCTWQKIPMHFFYLNSFI